MKLSVPTPQSQLLVHSICQQYNFSIQTKFNAISIMMHPNLRCFGNQNPYIVIAAIFISQKVHEVYPISVVELKPMNYETILDMEILIYNKLQYKVTPCLLIDEVFEVASLWDQFVKNITCIDINFLEGDSRHNQGLLVEITEKLAYKVESTAFEKRSLAVAIVWLIIRQAERKKFRSKMFRVGKSTQYIFCDFLSEGLGIKFEQISAEVRYASASSSYLLDLTSQFSNRPVQEQIKAKVEKRRSRKTNKQTNKQMNKGSMNQLIKI